MRGPASGASARHDRAVARGHRSAPASGPSTPVRCRLSPPEDLDADDREDQDQAHRDERPDRSFGIPSAPRPVRPCPRARRINVPEIQSSAATEPKPADKQDDALEVSMGLPAVERDEAVDHPRRRPGPRPQDRGDARIASPIRVAWRGSSDDDGPLVLGLLVIETSAASRSFPVSDRWSSAPLRRSPRAGQPSGRTLALTRSRTYCP